MRIGVRSVESVGVAIRAMRKATGIRQDDVLGQPCVLARFGEGQRLGSVLDVLKVLDELGIRMVLEVPDSQPARSWPA